ncbi:MAG: hypothetical protein IH991_17860 [Planctomycetes bacterium]|nr:hypothetical protein [Planctomycetota bacterium]
MWSTIFLTGCAFLGQPGDAVTETSRVDLAPQVRRLERQLNDDSLSRRSAAEKTLIEMGPDILDFLSPVTPRMPPERKIRIARIRKALELQLGEALANASVVSLDGEMSVSDALAAISKQTGNSITGHELRDGTIKAAFAQTPYWQTMDQVLDQAVLNLQSGRQPGQLVVVARPEEEAPRLNK